MKWIEQYSPATSKYPLELLAHDPGIYREILIAFMETWLRDQLPHSICICGGTGRVEAPNPQFTRPCPACVKEWEPARRNASHWHYIGPGVV